MNVGLPPMISAIANLYSVSQKIPLPFSEIFSQTVGNV